MPSAGQGYRRFGRHRAWIGARLAALRKKRGMLQSWLAEQIGVSTQQLCEYEHGRNSIPFEGIVLLSDILGVPLDYWRPDQAWLPPEPNAAPQPQPDKPQPKPRLLPSATRDPLLAALRARHPARSA